MYDFGHCLNSYILREEEQKTLVGIEPSTTLCYHTSTVSPGMYIFFKSILYALYDSHEQENDVTKEIRGNQIGAIRV
jgi:hypothetical protein